MTENRLLSDSVRLVSERNPEKRGRLFHVSNERKTGNPLEVMRSKSIGIFAGVADLIYFEGNLPWAGKNVIVGVELIGIELKIPGSYHKREHIESQVEWAKILESQGGVWRLCTDAEDAYQCTERNYKGLTIEEVEKILLEQKGKNIKF